MSSNLGQSLSRGIAATAPFAQGSLALRGNGRTSPGHRSAQQPQAPKLPALVPRLNVLRNCAQRSARARFPEISRDPGKVSKGRAEALPLVVSRGSGGKFEIPPEFFFGGLGVYSFNSERIHPQRQRAPARSPHRPPRGRQKPTGFPGTPGGVSEPRCPQGRPYSFSPVRPSRTRRSAIMAMNSELVGLPLVLETV